ncbi:hypothetical protein [Roseibium sp.]
MRLSSAGLLLILAAAAMIVFADFTPRPAMTAKAGTGPHTLAH